VHDGGAHDGETPQHDDDLSEASVTPPVPARPPSLEPVIAPTIAAAEAQTPPEPVPFSSVVRTESRSTVWPILLALIVGVMMGFALGFGVGSRDRSGAPAQAQTPPSSAAPPTARVAPSAEPVAPAQRQRAPAVTPPPEPARGTPPSASSEPSRTADRAAADARDRQRAATTPERTPDIGRLLVRSSPTGSRVALDGHDVGTTPLTLRDVATGTHVLRVTHQGYTAAEQRVRISAAQPAQSIEVELAAARAEHPAAPAQPGPAERTSGSPAAAPGAKVGSLIFDSRPTGARVLVDGKLVGTTPFLLENVAVGDHAVRLELDGFAAWSTSAHVNGGERTRVSGSLEQR